MHKVSKEVLAHKELWAIKGCKGFRATGELRARLVNLVCKDCKDFLGIKEPAVKMDCKDCKDISAIKGPAEAMVCKACKATVVFRALLEAAAPPVSTSRS